MTLQIFLHFFHHKFVTSLPSTSLPSAASALCPRRIRDALLLQRRSLTALCGPHPRHSPPTSTLIVAERRHSAITRYAERSAVCRDSARPCCRRAGGTPLLQSRSPTARAVTPSVNPRQRRGTSADADAPRSAAADALLPYIYSGTALRCIPTLLSSPGRCPGLTENGSALRTTAPLP